MYRVCHGDAEPLSLPTFGEAQEFMAMSVREMAKVGLLQGWREQALLNQIDNMPRAGFSFVDRDGVLTSVEKV